jgi:chromosomal replication initiator protein
MLAPYIAFPAVVAAWRRLHVRLRGHFGDAIYRQWIADLYPLAIENDTLILGTPHAITSQWLTLERADQIIITMLQEEWPGLRQIKCRIASASDTQESLFGQAHLSSAALSSALHANASEAELPTVFDSTALDPRFTFENFIVGKPNEFAYAAARKIAESDEVTSNPLFLYGGVGLGKTHLMHAIAHSIKERNPQRTVIYLSAEKFMYRFIRALRFKDTMSFKEQFRSVDVLMIDDVQFIAGKDSTQEEFFHTFNALIDQHKQIILSADKSPTDLNGIEERLKSRLSWGLVADLHPSTYELRLGILHSKAEQKNTQVPHNVLEFLAHKITSNIRELEGALNRLLAHAELVGKPITLDTTQDILSDLLRAYDRVVTMDDIQQKVCAHYGIKITDLRGESRSRPFARPRQIAMYLCKSLTTKSLPDIGRAFGGRDHTTVLHAVRKVDQLISQDQQMASDVELLRRALKFVH